MKRQRLTADRFERLGTDKLGDDVLRRKVRSHHPLRLRPRLPGVLNFWKVVFTETPLLLSLSVVAFLAGVVATLIYFLERDSNANVDGFVDACGGRSSRCRPTATAGDPTLSGEAW